MAEVLLTIGKQQMTQRVAVAPSESLERRVLLALDFTKDEDFELVKLCREGMKQVRMVKTRSQGKEEEVECETEQVSEITGVFVPKDPDRYVEVDKKEETVGDRVMEGGETRVEEASEEIEIVMNKGTAGDRVMEGDETRVEEVSEETEVEASGVVEESPDVVGSVKDYSLNLDCVKEGGKTEELRKQTREDDTLATWRGLADKGEGGFSWRDGLLVKTELNCLSQPCVLIALPKPFRKQVLQLAHEKSGLYARRKTQDLIRRSFLWPLLATDVTDHCKSCSTCQKMTKSGPCKAPMVRREIVSLPFEFIAIDIVGPFERGKGGYKYLLTYICMASKWPEAIPMKTETARSVLEALIEIFSRNGIPLIILSDQGTQLTGSLMKELCNTFGINKIQTSPYRPQSNGVVERLHGNLVPMIKKTMEHKLDWVKQVPLALYAMRLAPHSDIGVSPFEYIHGSQMHSPLDLLHNGWLERDQRKLNVSAWADELADRLELLRDFASEQKLENAKRRKERYDKHSVHREFKKGDRVLLRTPGLTGKLQESWTGLWEVSEKCGPVNYKVKALNGNGKGRVVHVNTMKEYNERIESVQRLMVVVEDNEKELEQIGEEKKIVGEGTCTGFSREELVKVLGEFDGTLSAAPGLTSLVERELDTGDCLPITQHPYRPPESLMMGIREELNSLLDQGIIVRSTSPWSSPMIPVRKPNGRVRICIDYRWLNRHTRQLQYYMPLLDEILDEIGQCSVVSKLDLSKGFYQVPMKLSDREKTAFVCPMGKFEFIRMPFGLTNAPSVFQQLMEQVLYDHRQYSRPYIDDIIVFSEDWQQHLKHMKGVLGALKEAGLTANPAKCEWGGRHMLYLGHIVGSGTLAVPDDRAKAMEEYVLPKTKKGLRSFLGSISYYRRFIPNVATYPALLTPATSKGAPSHLRWSDGMREAFHHLCNVLCNVCVLTVPTSSDTFTLHTDASLFGVGAVLNVVRSGEELPVAYYARQLRGAEKNYAATELEALAVVASIEHFAHYLYGREFCVITDNRALESLQTSKTLNRRLSRMALKLQQWNLSIIYRPGDFNGNADALSRQEWPADVAIQSKGGHHLSGGGCGDLEMDNPRTT